MGVVNKARAKATLTLLSRGYEIEDVQPPLIPKGWEKFPDSEDEWCGVEIPESENSSGCLYKAKAGSVFKPHIHRKRDEHFTIVNPKGKVQVITDSRIYTVSFLNSVFIPMGEPHAVKFLNDTTLLIMWHPKMDEVWEADFLSEKDINTSVE